MRLELLVAALAGAVLIEGTHYFKDPVAPDEVHIRPLPMPPAIVDAEIVVPESFRRECRGLGLQLIATKTDGPDWVYECLKVGR